MQSGTLESYLEDNGRMPLSRGLTLVDTLCEIIGERHREGLTDGALMPSRVTWREDGRAIVLPPEAGGAAPTSDDYLSPQQRDGKPADPRADVYALGVIAYRTLTGAMPYDSHAADPTDPVTYLPNLNDTVRRTLLIALQRNLTGRFADALTMRAALRGDSVVALDTPTLKWAVPEGIPQGDSGAADEYAVSAGLLGDREPGED
ncbi:MAG: protein kinase family protein [Coriobacteriia bacterium]